MPGPIPIEIRERAVAAYERGDGTADDVAFQFGVSRRALQRWVARGREEGTVAARDRGGGWRSSVDRKLLEAVLVDRRDATTHEVTAAYNSRVPRNARVHRSSIQRALHRFGYVFKKSDSGPRSKSGPTSLKSAESS